MASTYSLFYPKQFFKKCLKYSSLGFVSGLIPFVISAAVPRFEPPEHIGFQSGSLGDNILSVVQTGDVILLNQPQFLLKPVKWFFSQIQKGANYGDFEHIGVVVWHPKKQYPYIIEKSLTGTIATPFEDRIGWSNSQDILLRTLHLYRTPEFQSQAQQFVENEFEIALQSDTAFDRGWRWVNMFKSLSGSWYRDSQLKRLKPGTTLYNMHQTLDLHELQTAKLPEQRAIYDQLIEHTSKHGAVGKSDRVPLNRVINYAELVGTLKTLRQTEQILHDHLKAQDARHQYEIELNRFHRDQAFQNKKSTIELNDFHHKLDNHSHPPIKPLFLDDELSDKDLRLLLQKREMLHTDFELKYNQYRHQTILDARYGFFRPLNNDSFPAFPSCELVARLYQHLNLFPKPAHPKLSPIDVEALFPLDIPKLSEDERFDPYDLRQFNFAKVFEILTEFAPTSLEYKPYNFRQSNPLFLSGAVFGEEQFIIQSFNKPPIEQRTGNNTI